jgi:hypothetical protein
LNPSDFGADIFDPDEARPAGGEPAEAAGDAAGAAPAKKKARRTRRKAGAAAESPDADRIGSSDGVRGEAPPERSEEAIEIRGAAPSADERGTAPRQTGSSWDTEEPGAADAEAPSADRDEAQPDAVGPRTAERSRDDGSEGRAPRKRRRRRRGGGGTRDADDEIAQAGERSDDRDEFVDRETADFPGPDEEVGRSDEDEAGPADESSGSFPVDAATDDDRPRTDPRRFRGGEDEGRYEDAGRRRRSRRRGRGIDEGSAEDGQTVRTPAVRPATRSERMIAVPTPGGETQGQRVAVLIDLEALAAEARAAGGELAFGKLLQRVAHRRHLIRAIAYAEPTLARHSATTLRGSGIELREVASAAELPVALAVDAMALAGRIDGLVLAPDADRVGPLATALRAQGIRVETASFTAARGAADDRVQAQHTLGAESLFAP